MRGARKASSSRFQLNLCCIVIGGVCLLVVSLGAVVLMFANSSHSRSAPSPEITIPAVVSKRPSPSMTAAVRSVSPSPLAAGSPITIAGYQQQVVSTVRSTLSSHPFRTLTASQRSNFTMADYFEYLQKQPVCQGLPIITSMANVFSELYWQL